MPLSSGREIVKRWIWNIANYQETDNQSEKGIHEPVIIEKAFPVQQPEREMQKE